MTDSSFARLFDPFAPQARRVLEALAPEDDVDELLASSREHFARLALEMPYTDRREHTMWDATLAVFRWLAVHLACRERDIDVHALGAAILELGVAGGGGTGVEITDELAARALKDSIASQDGAPDNEFVFEIVPGDGESTDWGIDITRCAVCHAYANHDAMELTPYMCASDDVVSDRLGQGLRRTGTIALGAHRCDFRYKAGGEPQRLVEQYPEQIRTRARGGSR